MKGVELYRQVRHSVRIEGLSRRETGRRFGLDPRTVAKMLSFSVPPGYRRSRPPARPKLDPFVGIIDHILEADKGRPVKQRHTSKRIFERLRDEYGYGGGMTIVKDYVHERRQRQREVFVPLRHEPGHAQADFGEAWAVIGGVEQKIHFFAMDLPHSDAGFVQAYPAETTEAFCAAHVAAFNFFGKVPRSILYDNTKIAVVKILGDGKRKRTKAFSELQSHYLFEDRFGRPAKGNDKGKVEGLVGYARRNFMVPLPRVHSIDELNAKLAIACEKRQVAVLRGHKTSIGERLSADRQMLMELPDIAFDPCEKVCTRVNSLSLVRYRSNDYSVPTTYGHHDVQVRGYFDRVVIACGSEVIACHVRSYAKEDFIYNPLHYLALLERKPRALDQAAPLLNWDLPGEFDELRRLLELRMDKRGRKEYIQVLRLMETFGQEEVAAAVEDALRLNAMSYDAVKHLVLAKVERRTPRLDLSAYPYLPQAHVGMTDVRNYLSLLVAHHHHNVEVAL